MKSILKKATSAITLILLSVFTISYFSCSKNDDGPGTVETPQLELTASATEVETGQEVIFTVAAASKNIPDAAIYIDGTSIIGYTHTFTEEGTFQVVAKKEGYQESNFISINVNAPETIKATPIRVSTAPRNPSLGSQFRMCVDQNLKEIFTFDRENDKFMSYNIESNSWRTLAYGGQLIYAGYGGKMLGNTRNGQIYYLNDQKHIYNTFYFNEIPKRDTWEPSENIDDLFAAGEAGYALENGYIYSVGGRMDSKNSSSDIRKYNMVSNTWEKVGNTHNTLRRANAIISDKKLYILGEGEGGGQIMGTIFHTEELTVKNWILPTEMPNGISSTAYQMAIYGNDHFLLFYARKTLYIYNLRTEKWEIPAKIEGDFLYDSNVNLFSRGNTLYAAGSKDGNFALYELKLEIPAGW
ncbi:MAG TPA: kelch repeat-containing protein [Aequorivita sp.]|nr:kelch repeat-containing protein [Aequorivita sp.]